MRLVFDTNVLVSALITPKGTARRSIDAAIHSTAIVLYDERILLEYAEVTTRAKFRGKYPPNAPRELLLALLARSESVVGSPSDLVLPDPTDAPFLEVAIAGQADAIVTGNAKHYPASSGVPIFSPQDLVRRLHQQRPDR